MKLPTLAKRISRGCALPWFYGYAYVEHERLCAIAYPVPLNLIVRLLRAIWQKLIVLRFTKLDQLQTELREREVEAAFLRNTLDFHPRARKLMVMRKNFLVVATTEPYFAQVYALIREHESAKGAWTPEDELAYRTAISGTK